MGLISFKRWRCLVRACFFICALGSLSPLIFHEIFKFPYNHNQQRRVPNYTCPTTRKTIAEDVLCIKRKTFLKNFKNPCWLEKETHGMNSSYKNGFLQCLPYFHLFGVCKTGTTDLFSRLTQHPLILENFGDLHKETTFWSWGRYGKNGHPGHAYVKETLYNFTQFFNAEKIGETKLLLEDMTEYSDVITGHADPMDFWDHSDWREIPQNDPTADVPKFMTPHLVKHVQPNVKLILMLRQPAERLYSHYYHGQYGNSAEKFHHDVVKEIELLKNCSFNNSYRACLYGKNMTQRPHIPITASLYYLHLQEWLDVFPLKQIFILRNEDYQKDMKYTLQRLFQFLEVDAIPTKILNSILTTKRKYVTQHKVKEGSMFKKTWDILNIFFKDWNKKLASLLNDERYLWKDTPYRFKPAKKENKTKVENNRPKYSNKTELRNTTVKNASLTKKINIKPLPKQNQRTENQSKVSNETQVRAAEKPHKEKSPKDDRKNKIKAAILKTTSHHEPSNLEKPGKQVTKKKVLDQTKSEKTSDNAMFKNKKRQQGLISKSKENKPVETIGDTEKDTVALLQKKGFLL